MRVLKPFEYFEPGTVAQAVRLLLSYGDKAKVLAGGVDLIPRMRQRKVTPEYVVNIQRIAGLDYIRGNGSKGLRFGALTTLHSLELSPRIQKDYTVLYEAVHHIASVQVKTMGTAVGNLCVATPASDVATALIALGAEVKIVSVTGERTIPIENFFVGVGQTILEPGQIVTEVLLPDLPARTGGAFLKLVRTAADIAKVNVAVNLRVTSNKCEDVKIVLGSVAPTVFRAIKAEKVLGGQKPDPEVIKAAAEAAATQAKPITDLRSTAEYRRETTEVLVRRALERALEGAKA